MTTPYPAANIEPLKDTVDLFWTPHHLALFQEAWDNGDWESPWSIRMYQQNISFDHHKTEVAVEADELRLWQAARSGCNLTLGRQYAAIHDKWSKRGNDKACDYLANCWDCISTLQCEVASRWGVYILWSDEELS